jgi:hypothetical protein
MGYDVSRPLLLWWSVPMAADVSMPVATSHTTPMWELASAHLFMLGRTILRHTFHQKLSYLIFMPQSSTHHMCASDHLFYTHGSKVFTDSQMSWIMYNYYINIVHQRLRWLSWKQNIKRLHNPQESNRGSASLELLIKEFHSIFIFWAAGLSSRRK